MKLAIDRSGRPALDADPLNVSDCPHATGFGLTLNDAVGTLV
jgi:hypothetical protein